MDPRYAGPGRTPPPMRKKRNWIGRVMGLSIHTATTTPAERREEASASVASASLT